MAKAKKKIKKSMGKKPMAKKSTPKKTVKKSVKKIAKVAKKTKPIKNNFVKSKAPVEKISASSLKNFVTPLDDRLIVEIASGEKRTAGGLYIPDTATVAGQFKGLVLITGRGHRDNKGRIRPMDVKNGDTVLFSEHAGSKINLMGQDFRILRESEILGIIEKS